MHTSKKLEKFYVFLGNYDTRRSREKITIHKNPEEEKW